MGRYISRHHLKRIERPDMRETVKELAQLDGAFIVSNEGVVLSACRYINASTHGIHLPLGLGSGHIAAASITRETNAIAVVVLESLGGSYFRRWRIGGRDYARTMASEADTV